MKALVRWAVFCAGTGRRMRIDQDTRAFFRIGDRDDLSYEDKLERYRTLADDYFQVEEYEAFCAEQLGSLDGIALEYFSGREFDDLLVETVTSTFPPHEHEQMVARHRGLLGAWVADQAPAPA